MYHIERWHIKYNLAKNYYSHYGNLEIPIGFKTKNGIDYAEDGINIGDWLYRQRTEYNDGILDEVKCKLLMKIGMRFKTKNKLVTWDDLYKLAKIYYDNHGNLDFPKDFRTKDGLTYSADGYCLKGWIKNQKSYQSSGDLSKEKENLLTNIGVVFYKTRDFDDVWLKIYNLLKIYYEHYNSTEVSDCFKTKNGIDFDEEGIALGGWCNNQRIAYRDGKLKPERFVLLSKLNFRFEKSDKYEKKWQDTYILIKKYYDYYGNLDIPKDFKTTNGIEYDEAGTNIESWLRNQFSNYNNNRLKKERIELLNALNIDFEGNSILRIWNERLEYLKIYYKHYHNINVPYDFETKNGYEHEKGGVKLGIWLNNQRISYEKGSLDPERFLILSEMGMLWNIKKSDNAILLICEEYNIDFELNSLVLKHMSHYELNAKINYLIGNGLPVTINGTLHEIFSICSKNLEIKYNITYENLMKAYYNKNLLLDLRCSN